MKFYFFDGYMKPRKLDRRILSLLNCLSTMFVLSACGGGGGGSVQPATIAAPVVSTSVSPVAGSVIPATTSLTVTTAISGASSVTLNNAVVTCDGNSIAIPAVTVPISGGEAKILPVSGRWPDGAAMCTATLAGVASNTGGNTEIKLQTSFSVVAAAVTKVVTHSLVITASKYHQVPIILERYADGTFAIRELQKSTSFTMGGSCLIQAKPISSAKWAGNCLDSLNFGHNVIFDFENNKTRDDDGSLGVFPPITDAVFWVKTIPSDPDANPEHGLTIKNLDGSQWIEDGYAGMITFVNIDGTKTIAVPNNSMGSIVFIFVKI